MQDEPEIYDKINTEIDTYIQKYPDILEIEQSVMKKRDKKINDKLKFEWF